jgi:hypothetical protein
MNPNNGNNETFFVYQIFADGSTEKVTDEPVPAERAVTIAKGLIASIGGRLGTTQRVMITDWGDLCVFDWMFGKGIVFPPKEVIHGTGTQEDQSSFG